MLAICDFSLDKNYTDKAEDMCRFPFETIPASLPASYTIDFRVRFADTGDSVIRGDCAKSPVCFESHWQEIIGRKRNVIYADQCVLRKFAVTRKIISSYLSSVNDLSSVS